MAPVLAPVEQGVLASAWGTKSLARILQDYLRGPWNSWTLFTQEERFWLKKSRVNWMKKCDGNTRYFNTSTVIKRKKNLITS